MAVRIIRIAILCHGRSLPRKNVRSVEDIWSKKGINYSVRMRNAVIL